MNRVIKFRFFDTIESKYQKDGSVLLGSAGEPFSLVSNGHGYNVQYRNECIPEEFTGLKDKNGKEIYEGDVLIQSIKSEFLDPSDWEEIKGLVIMVNGQWCVKDSRFPLYAFENKVIGNIH